MNTTTLYVSDLDGTLLNNGSFVSDRSAELLSDLSADGAMFTVATARTPATVVPLLANVHSRIPYIVLTGAATFDPRREAYAHRHVIPPAHAMMLYECFRLAGVNPFVYHYDHTNPGHLLVWHEEEMTREERNFYDERKNLQLKRFSFRQLEHPCADVALFFALGTADVIGALAQRIELFGKFSVSYYPDIFNPQLMMMEVFDHGVSKAGAVSLMARKCKAQRIVVFGDNINDLPMMKIADVAVAVANAHPLVKEQATVVIGPNYDDSVARYIYDDYYASPAVCPQASSQEINQP